MFHQEFEQALREDEVYQDEKTLKRFLLICERLIHKWQQNYLTDWRSGKRALYEPPRGQERQQEEQG